MAKQVAATRNPGVVMDVVMIGALGVLGYLAINKLNSLDPTKPGGFLDLNPLNKPFNPFNIPNPNSLLPGGGDVNWKPGGILGGVLDGIGSLFGGSSSVPSNYAGGQLDQHDRMR